MRFGKGDWIDIGLAALASRDEGATTMAAICRQAGKTRGPFYYHFENIEDFWIQTARIWQKRFTGDLIKSTSGNLPSSKRLDQLNTLVARLDPTIEQGMRSLAVRQPAVADIVQSADAARVDYLTRLYRGAGLPQVDAASIARIEYAAFVGMLQTETDTSPEDIQNLYSDFLRLTGR